MVLCCSVHVFVGGYVHMMRLVTVTVTVMPMNVMMMVMMLVIVMLMVMLMLCARRSVGSRLRQPEGPVLARLGVALSWWTWRGTRFVDGLRCGSSQCCLADGKTAPRQ